LELEGEGRQRQAWKGLDPWRDHLYFQLEKNEVRRPQIPSQVMYGEGYPHREVILLQVESMVKQIMSQVENEVYRQKLLWHVVRLVWQQSVELVAFAFAVEPGYYLADRDLVGRVQRFEH
jgi:hypothetical protein